MTKQEVERLIYLFVYSRPMRPLRRHILGLPSPVLLFQQDPKELKWFKKRFGEDWARDE